MLFLILPLSRGSNPQLYRTFLYLQCSSSRSGINAKLLLSLHLGRIGTFRGYELCRRLRGLHTCPSLCSHLPEVQILKLSRYQPKPSCPPLPRTTPSTLRIVLEMHSRLLRGSMGRTTIYVWRCNMIKAPNITVVNIPGGWCSISYSPYGRHIISGSKDSAIRIWDAETGTAVGKPLEGIPRVWSPPTLPMGSTSSLDLGTVQFEFGMPRLVPQSVGLWSEKLQASCQLLALQIGSTLIQDLITTLPVCRNQLLLLFSSNLCQFLFTRGSTRDSDGSLLYWVPPYCRSGLYSPVSITIPIRFDHRPVSLDFEDFAFGPKFSIVHRSSLSFLVMLCF